MGVMSWRTASWLAPLRDRSFSLSLPLSNGDWPLPAPVDHDTSDAVSMRALEAISLSTPATAESPEARDERILRGIRAGAQSALAEAFEAHYGGLYRYAHHFVRSPDVAQELIQDVFLRVWERRLELHGGERLAPYLFVAVRNAAISWLRHARLERAFYERSGPPADQRGADRRPAADDERALAGMSQAACDAADAVRRQEEWALADELHEAIQTLPRRAREAITLRWQRQLKNTEIAEVMGCSVKAVEFSIARALDALRRIVDPS